MCFPSLTWFLECPEVSLESSGTPWGCSAVLEPHRAPGHLARATPPSAEPWGAWCPGRFAPCSPGKQGATCPEAFFSPGGQIKPSEGLPGWGHTAMGAQETQSKPWWEPGGAGWGEPGGGDRHGHPNPGSEPSRGSGASLHPGAACIRNLSYAAAESWCGRSSAGIWGLWLGGEKPRREGSCPEAFPALIPCRAPGEEGPDHPWAASCLQFWNFRISGAAMWPR